MSDGLEQLTQGGVAAPVDASQQPTAGEILRQAREESGMPVGALAAALKVSVKKLEALEADRLDLLPDAVFVRALASSVCRTLKIDPAPVLSQLPQTAVPRLEYDGVGHGLNTPFQSPGDVSRVSVLNQLSKPVVLAALALMMGALVLIFFPAVDSVLAPAPGTAESATPAAMTTAVAQPSPAPAVTQVVPVGDGIAAKRKPSAPEPAAQVAPVAKAAPAAPPAASRPAPSASGTPVTTLVQGKATRGGIVVFRTQGPSWVEVTDAEGGVQIRRTISAGEVVGVSGPLPLSVVVGRADITEVEVHGKPFPLPSVSKENVARFEVK